MSEVELLLVNSVRAGNVEISEKEILTDKTFEV